MTSQELKKEIQSISASIKQEYTKKFEQLKAECKAKIKEATSGLKEQMKLQYRAEYYNKYYRADKKTSKRDKVSIDLFGIEYKNLNDKQKENKVKAILVKEYRKEKRARYEIDIS